jgi:alpha-tubulin suppressor-like RCC1 family protein
MREVRHTIVALLLAAIVGCDERSQSPLEPSEPAAVLALATASAPLAFSHLTVGGQHTCGISNGRAYCWGYGFLGQLGAGTSITQAARPTRVSGGLQFSQLSPGRDHTCGLALDDRAYCWGENQNGQLGDGTKTNRFSPVAVAGGRRFRQIRAGSDHTCAVTPTNVGFCWGRGTLLGDGTNSDRTIPVRVLGGLSWRRIVAGGTHTCGVTTTDRAYCWGWNYAGQLGDGTNSGRLKPVAVAGGLGFRQVIAGANHTCGISLEQRAYCWGDNDEGQLGNGILYTRQRTPSPVLGTRRWSQVIAGFNHTCGVTTADVAFCWGQNDVGQNGDGTTNPSSAPVRVAGGHAFDGISTGVQQGTQFDGAEAKHSCALTTTNQAYCWGWNIYGQLGDGTNSGRLTPVAVVGPA